MKKYYCKRCRQEIVLGETMYIEPKIRKVVDESEPIQFDYYHIGCAVGLGLIKEK